MLIYDRHNLNVRNGKGNFLRNFIGWQRTSYHYRNIFPPVIRNLSVRSNIASIRKYFDVFARKR